MSVDLRCCDTREMLASLPDGCASLIVGDPPWQYSDGGRDKHRGIASMQYGVVADRDVAATLASAYRVGATDSYLALWCTFPKLMQWASAQGPLIEEGWRYITGACWGKTDNRGVGHHFRGDAELLLLYKKGHAAPSGGYGGYRSNLWLSARAGHSEKPQIALRALVNMGADPGGLVVDLYAGASASLAWACRSLGRNYVGAEIDPERHTLAMVRLSQQEMALV